MPVSPVTSTVESVPATMRTLLENAEQRGRIADDVRERGLGTDLLLQVDVLLLEARLEGGDLLVGEQVLDGEDTCSEIAERSETSLSPYRPASLLARFSVPMSFPLIAMGTEMTQRRPTLTSAACSTNSGDSWISGVSKGSLWSNTQPVRVFCRGHSGRVGAMGGEGTGPTTSGTVKTSRAGSWRSTAKRSNGITL